MVVANKPSLTLTLAIMVFLLASCSTSNNSGGETGPFLVGQIELADGENPAGAFVEVVADSNATNEDLQTALTTTRTLVQSDGSFRASIPETAPRPEVRVHRPGYTQARRPVTPAEIQTAQQNGQANIGKSILYPLTGFVNIVSGTYANTPTVTLQISAFNGVSQMALGEMAAEATTCSYGAASEYQAELAYAIQNTSDGEKTICVKVSNDYGQTLEMTRGLLLDQTPPAGSLLIELGAPFSTSALVTLQLFGSDALSGIRGVYLADSQSALATAELLSFDAIKLWTLAEPTGPGQEGERSVWLQLEDWAGNRSNPSSDSIFYDQHAPELSSVLLNSGAVNTAINRVNLAIVATGAEQMMIAENAAFAGAAWVNFVDNLSINLSSGDGLKTIYVKVRDLAGNVAGPASDTILLDVTPPDPPALQVIDVNGDGFALSASSVELKWSLPVGANHFELQRLIVGQDSDFITLTSPSAPQDTYQDLTIQAGAQHQYRIRAGDAVGNLSSWSLAAVATPFAPITQVVWIRNEENFQFDFMPAAGTFGLGANYRYEDLTGETHFEVLPNNVTRWPRPTPVQGNIYQETLILRTSNQDNSLVFDSEFVLPFNLREVLSDSQNDGNGLADLAVDAQGYDHIIFQRGNKLGYATNKSGSWVFETVDNTCCYAEHGAIALDSNGKVHISYYRSDTAGLHYATNKSGTWRTYTVDDAVHVVGTRSAIAVSANGVTHIAYYDFTNGDLEYARNSGSGAWLKDTVDSSGDSGDFVSLALTSNGNPHISYKDDSVLGYATRTDSASTGGWSFQTPDGGGGYDTDIFVDSSDKIYIAYTDSSCSFVKIRDTVGVWNLTNVDNLVCNNLAFRDHLSATIDSAGVIHVAYYDAINFDMKYATNRSGSFERLALDAVGDFGRWAAVAADSDNNPHFVYFDDGTKKIRIAKRVLNNAAPFDNPPWKNEIPAASHLLSTLQISAYDGLALDSDGTAYVYYYDADQGDLAWSTRNPTTGLWSDGGEDDTVGDVGKYISMQFSGTNKRHVAYYDATNGNLKYLEREAGLSIETVDSVGDVGYYAALTINTSAKPYIAYWDATNSRLKIADKVTGSWRFNQLDTNGNGRYASVALDRDGFVHVAYEKNGGLGYTTNRSGQYVTTTVDSECCVQWSTAIAVDNNNRVYITYHNGSAHDLRYATNQSGSWQSEVIDYGSDAGYHNRLVLDSNQTPHVLYWRAGAVRYAVRLAQSWHHALIEDDTTIARSGSIALDATGRIHMLFQDDTNNRLLYSFGKFAGLIGVNKVSQTKPF